MESWKRNYEGKAVLLEKGASESGAGMEKLKVHAFMNAWKCHNETSYFVQPIYTKKLSNIPSYTYSPFTHSPTGWDVELLPSIHSLSLWFLTILWKIFSEFFWQNVLSDNSRSALANQRIRASESLILQIAPQMASVTMSASAALPGWTCGLASMMVALRACCRGQACSLQV